MVKTVIFFITLIVAALNTYAREEVWFTTDRTLYIAGEQVHLSAIVTGEPDAPVGSKVLYAEVITPDGAAISKNKFMIVDGHTTGSFIIPAETLTGYYYVRAYTKFMRNAGPAAYTYLRIKIVNPYRGEVLPGLTTAEPQVINDSMQPSGYSIQLIRSDYRAGDTVKFNLPSQHTGNILAVTVVPQSTYTPYFARPEVSGESNGDNYCKETRSLSISGVMTNATTLQPVSEKNVNVSVIGAGQDFIVTTTDETGRFYFALPALEGERDLYLSPETTLGNNVRMLIDNDFCNIKIKLPSPVFTISGHEKAVVLRLAANARVGATYADTALQPAKAIDNSPFYGTPDQVMLLDKYVQLPTLEEYFNEIPALAKVRRSGGKKIIKVMGLQPEMTTYAPLVFIDRVAVNEPERILAAAPSNVQRIEIINRPYLKGEKIYGGIVSVISRKGDFAGIDLPASGTFVNFRFYNELPVADFTPQANMPDARNTVYFNAPPAFNAVENNNLTFVAPGTPGTYEIVVFSVNADGLTGISRMPFVVK